MIIGFIGYGQVARAFAAYFKNFRDFIQTIHHSRAQGESLNEVINKAEIIFIATPDDAIADLAEKIARDTSEEALKRKFFCIFSGALSSEVMRALKEKGATVASLHPPMTFADTLAAQKNLPDILCAFEGEGAGLNDFMDFLKAVNIKYQTIRAEKKPVYHAAMCLASNYTAALLDASVKMLAGSGLNETEAMELLTPLVQATVKNCLQRLPSNSLTGPIARGDSEIIKLHLNQIEPEFKNLYRELGLWALKIAKLDNHRKTLIKEILKNE